MNLDKGIWKKIDEAVGRETTELEVFDYIYGVLHEKEYRERYKEFLKIDFPRVPGVDKRRAILRGSKRRGMGVLYRRVSANEEVAEGQKGKDADTG